MAKAKLVVSTEIWNTQNGKVFKAVVRDTNGKFIGATNQTKAIPVKSRAKATASYTLVGR
jgi:hypothetical protein